MSKARPLSIAVALAVSLPFLVAAAPPRPELRKACGAGAIFRTASLPRQALAALGGRMADPNQPFQSSDAIPAGPRLPFHRLICAERTPDGYAVRFEYGGRAYGTRIVYLRREADGRFVEEAGPAVQGR